MIVAVLLGLDTVSVRGIIDLQMKAAKALQYRYRAQLLFLDKIPNAPNSLNNERKQIAAIGEELLRLLATRLMDGVKIDDTDRQPFITMLDTHDLTNIERGMLFDALQCVILT